MLESRVESAASRIPDFAEFGIKKFQSTEKGYLEACDYLKSVDLYDEVMYKNRFGSRVLLVEEANRIFEEKLVELK